MSNVSFARRLEEVQRALAEGIEVELVQGKMRAIVRRVPPAAPPATLVDHIRAAKESAKGSSKP